jgi:dihydrofolate synthase/folylpolyglutamate synthase
VFEVGMGGRWDATNLIASDVAVVTPVGMDHVAELGPTIVDIATEKAGIIKEGKTAVVRAQEPEVAETLARRAADVGATLLHECVDWEISEALLAVGGQAFTLRSPLATYEDLYLPVFGSYAAANAGAGVDADVVREGLAAVRTPGRLEIVAHEPTVVFDGAHNPAGAAALVEALPRTFTWERLHVVLAVSAKKDVAGVVGPIARLADVVYATANDSVRSAEPEMVRAAALADGAADVRLEPSVAAALAAAREAAAPGDLVLVTGSLFTVADAKRALAARG